MANLLQSSQNTSTTAPSYYNTYLSCLANKGMQQAGPCGAQFVGAQPLQNQAFNAVGQNFGAQQGNFQQGQNLLGCAANTNITGAGAGYIQAGTQNSGLGAMQPYANQALATSGTQVASPYVNQGASLCATGAANPYIQAAASQGGLCAAQGYLNKGTNANIVGAAQPLINQAASRGGLCAASPYLQQAATNNPGQLAQCYMNPYLKNQVQNVSDIAMRNIQQNLAPQATAAAVGSGQFGSQRGAQVLGQVEANAMQCLNNTIAGMESQGYGQALTAAGAQQSLLGQLGGTAGNLGQSQQALLGQLAGTAACAAAKCAGTALTAGQTAGSLAQQQQGLLGTLGQTAGTLTSAQMQNLINAGGTLGGQQTATNQIAAGLGNTAAGAQNAYNANLLQAGATSGCLAARQAAAKTAAAQGIGSLAGQAATQNLACINALSTLGGQQQTILQNQQCYPLTKLSNISNLLKGYTVPTSTKQTMCMSPLSGLASVGSTAAGLFGGTGKCGTGPSVICQIKKSFGGVQADSSSPTGFTNGAGQYVNQDGSAYNAGPTGNTYGPISDNLINSMPSKNINNIDPSLGWSCGCAEGGSVKAARGGPIGCVSTRHMGGLPSYRR